MAEDKQAHADAQQAQEVFGEIAPLLVGLSSPIQGNIIAMLLGVWLAGHAVKPMKGMDEKDRIAAQRDLRARLMVVTTNAAFAYAAANDQQREKGPEVRQ